VHHIAIKARINGGLTAAKHAHEGIITRFGAMSASNISSHYAESTSLTLLSRTDHKKSYSEAAGDFCAHITRLPGQQANAISRYLEPASRAGQTSARCRRQIQFIRARNLLSRFIDCIAGKLITPSFRKRGAIRSGRGFGNWDILVPSVKLGILRTWYVMEKRRSAILLLLLLLLLLFYS